jgi:hypothetical protein
MKNLITLFLAVLLFSTSAIAQTRKADTIFKIDGDSLSIYITSVNEKEIVYTFPEESITNVISKNVVREVHYGSGRKEVITEKIIIRGEHDWEKVLITTLESDIKGLVRKGEVKAKATGGTTFANQQNVDDKATMKLKKEAARMGAHIVLIQSQKTESGSYGFNAYGTSSLPKSLKQGVAYSYK